MEHFEMVDKLRERANVSYEEARAALEESDWDLLDAMVLLEQRGKMNYEYSEEYSTKEEVKNKHRNEHKNNAQTVIDKLLRELKRAIKKGNAHNLVFTYRDKEVISLPITIVVILLILLAHFFVVIVLAFFVAYLFGVRYSIVGPDTCSCQEEASAESSSEEQAECDYDKQATEAEEDGDFEK